MLEYLLDVLGIINEKDTSYPLHYAIYRSGIYYMFNNITAGLFIEGVCSPQKNVLLLFILFLKPNIYANS